MATTTTLLIAYRLRSGVDPSDYERWVHESDAPFVVQRPTVLRYEVHRVGTLVESGAGPPFDFIELLEVEDLEDDRRLIEGPEGSALDAEWRRLTQDPFVATVQLVTAFSREASGG